MSHASCSVFVWMIAGYLATVASAGTQLGRFIGVIEGLPEVRRIAFMDDRTAFAVHAGEPPVVRLIFDDADSPPRVEQITREAARQGGAPSALWNVDITPDHPFWVDPPPEELFTPIALIRDGGGNTLLLDKHANHLHRFDSITGIWRGVGDWGAFPGLFAHPSDMAAADGRIYVADTRNHRVQIFDDRLSYLGEWGLHVVRPHEDGGHLHYPEGIAVSGDGMLAIVAEPMQDRLQIFGVVLEDNDSTITEPMFERETIAHFSRHTARDGHLLVTTEPDRPGLIVWDLSRPLPIMIGQIVGHGDEFGRFRSIGDVALRLDGPNGVPRIWALDPAKQRLQVFDLDWSPDDELGFDPFLARFVRAFDLPKVIGRNATSITGFFIRNDGTLVLHDSSDGSLVLTDARLRPVKRYKDIHPPRTRVRLKQGPDDRTIALLHMDTGQLDLLAINGGTNRETFNLIDTGRMAEISLTGHAEEITSMATKPAEFSDVLFIAGSERRELWYVSRQSHRVLRGALGAPGRTGAPRTDGEIHAIVPEIVLGLSNGMEPQHPRDRLGPGLFHKPSGLIMDHLGQLIVIDDGNHRIQFFDQDGRFLDTYGALWYTQVARRSAPGRMNR